MGELEAGASEDKEEEEEWESEFEEDEIIDEIIDEDEEEVVAVRARGRGEGSPTALVLREPLDPNVEWRGLSFGLEALLELLWRLAKEARLATWAILTLGGGPATEGVLPLLFSEPKDSGAVDVGVNVVVGTGVIEVGVPASLLLPLRWWVKPLLAPSPWILVILLLLLITGETSWSKLYGAILASFVAINCESCFSKCSFTCGNCGVNLESKYSKYSKLAYLFEKIKNIKWN